MKQRLLVGLLPSRSYMISYMQRDQRDVGETTSLTATAWTGPSAPSREGEPSCCLTERLLKGKSICSRRPWYDCVWVASEPGLIRQVLIRHR